MNSTDQTNIDCNLSSDAKTIFFILKEGKNVEEKLKHFKQFLLKVKKEDNRQLQDVIAIYFLLESKHPVKSLIQSYLNQLNDKKPEAIKLFTDFIQNQVKESQAQEYTQNCRLINYLNELSQNFEVASIAVGHSSEHILQFLNRVIELQIQQLTTILSPTKKIEVSHNLHNSLQAYIFCIRSSLQHSDEENKSNFLLHVEKLIKTCDNIFESSDISTETKNIFSMIIVLKNDFLNKNDHQAIIEDENENLDKRLCLIFGVIQITNDENINNIKKFCNIMETVYNDNSIDNAIVYTISRLNMQIIKKLSSFKSIENYDQISTTVKPASFIAFLNLEHSVESIRYLSKETIRNLIELGLKVSSGEKLIDDIFEKISSLPIDLKSSVISSIQSIIAVKTILKRLPDLLEMILSSICMNKESKISCYITLSNKGCNELSFEDWYEIFINPLEKRIQGYKEAQEKISLWKNLLLKCIKKDKRAIQMLLENRNNFDRRFNFMILNLAKEEGLLEKNFEDVRAWRGIISYNELRNAMVDIDVEIRLSALYLIVDTKKVTDRFLSEEIECILYFFENNISLQTPSTKQALVGSIKRIFTRFRCAIQYMKRQNRDEVDNQLETLIKFCKFSIKNLSNEANYSRRSLSLILLLNVHEILKEYFPDEIVKMWDKNNFGSLNNVLYDTYEHNKEKALELMAYLPKNILESYSDITFEYLEKLHKSIKPADSLTASYMILFSIKFSKIQTENSLSNPQSYLYELIIWCEKQLTDALKVAENSIIVAAGSNPMYGFIYSIRTIISQINLSDILICANWRDFFERLIDILKRLAKVAAPIVNDSSPEGIYPNENIHLLINNENVDYVSNVIQNTTSQMILLCAWRIIKETSLLFGDLSSKSSILCGSDHELYSVNQLIDIGDHFLELLTNIKHRGAFEQCFNGFSQYCISLRNSQCYELHNLPCKILNNILDSISKNSDELQDKNLIRMKNLCATRRSAGLPFIIQALLLSEAKISRYENFHYTMKKLLNLAQFGNELEIRIHSLNILRVLYRCKELNDVINEYISEGIKCSILGCGSETWSERNSSTLLFSALMIRTFGVQRNKDCEQIDIKNKMSSKIFFLRYPELYDFFMDQLNQSTKFVKKQEIDPKLYPLLLILNRLFTSNTEKCDSNLKLINFILMVTSCSGCVDLKARILCAKFVANVNPIGGILPRINTNIQILRDYTELASNDKHGRLLEILYLLKNISNLQSKQNMEPLTAILNELLRILKIFRKQIICFATLLDGIIHLFQILWNQNFEKFLDQKLIENCFDFEKTSLFGIQAMHSQLLIVELIQMKLKSEIKFSNISNDSLNYYQLLPKLNCIILILTDAEKRKKIVDDYEIDSRIYFFIDNLSDQISIKFKNEIYLNEKFNNVIEMLTKHKDFVIQARSYEILSLTSSIKIHNVTEINSLLRSTLSKNDEYKIAVLKYIKSWMEINEESVDLIEWKAIAELLYFSYYVKLSIIDLLKVVGKHLCSTSLRTTFYYSTMIINLLTDDDSDVCEEVSKVVSNILGINQVFIGSNAVRLYVKFAMKSLSFQTNEKVLLFLLILFNEEKLNMETSEKEFNEFEIFEKSESNSSKEWFVIKEIIVSIFKDELHNNSSFPLNEDEIVSKLIDFCNEIEQTSNCKEITNFLKKLNLST